MCYRYGETVLIGVILIVGTLLLQLVTAHGADTPKLISHEALVSRSYSTWEGSYAFTEEMTLRIEGLPDLHVFIYRHPDHEGALINFAELASDDNFYLLREADTNVKGVTPILEGIDVLPDVNKAEIIVRWRHPGQGGLRSVKKYRYSPNDLEFVTGSDFVSDGRKMKWIRMRSTTPSTPAKLKLTGQP